MLHAMLVSRAGLVLGCLVLAAGCKETSPESKTKVPSVEPAPAPPPEPREQLPWYVGEWTANVSLKPVAPPPEADALERRKARGKSKTTEATSDTAIQGPEEGLGEAAPLTLHIDKQRHATGQFLGLRVSGELDEKTLRARLSGALRSAPMAPENAPAEQGVDAAVRSPFSDVGSGVLMAERTEDGLSATLRLSSGDSKRVYASQFLLRKPSQQPSAPAAGPQP